MPKIRLKPNSAEYDEEQREIRSHGCDMPGCARQAEFKAPRDRSLSGHYRFCLEHVQEYNQAWDFFSGMAQRDIETHIVSSTLGDRPTWRYDTYATLEENLRRRAWQHYRFTEREPEEDGAGKPAASNPEHEAMAIMGLAPPLTFPAIKARYKELAKKHHPDLNRHDPQAEELLKRINMAYTILKLAYEKFETLDKN